MSLCDWSSDVCSSDLHHHWAKFSQFTITNFIFKMTYEVVLLRPFKNEVCDGVIEKILPNDGGIHVRVGPMLVFISSEDIPNNYKLDEKNNCYTNEKDDNDSLKEGEKVRFRYKEIQFNISEFKPIGTMNDNFLGHILE